MWWRDPLTDLRVPNTGFDIRLVHGLPLRIRKGGGTRQGSQSLGNVYFFMGCTLLADEDRRLIGPTTEKALWRGFYVVRPSGIAWSSHVRQ